jgi:hypothetical protein
LNRDQHDFWRKLHADLHASTEVNSQTTKSKTENMEFRDLNHFKKVLFAMMTSYNNQHEDCQIAEVKASLLKNSTEFSLLGEKDESNVDK